MRSCRFLRRRMAKFSSRVPILPHPHRSSKSSMQRESTIARAPRDRALPCSECNPLTATGSWNSRSATATSSLRPAMESTCSTRPGARVVLLEPAPRSSGWTPVPRRLPATPPARTPRPMDRRSRRPGTTCSRSTETVMATVPATRSSASPFGRECSPRTRTTMLRSSPGTGSSPTAPTAPNRPAPSMRSIVRDARTAPVRPSRVPSCSRPEQGPSGRSPTPRPTRIS